jgi:hypothetical protein
MTVTPFENPRTPASYGDPVEVQDPSFRGYWTYESPQKFEPAAREDIDWVSVLVYLPLIIMALVAYLVMIWVYAQSYVPEITILGGVGVSVPSVLMGG